MTIDKIIINQIMSQDPHALGAYGCVSIHGKNIVINGKSIEETTELYQGGLKLKVDGYNKSVSTVDILLHWNDTYTVMFKDTSDELVKQVDDVYFDQLIEVLDFIEENNENSLEINFCLN